MQNEQTLSAWENVSEADFLARLNRVFAQNRLDRYLSRERAEKLYLLARRLFETNTQYTLSAITDPDGIIFKHFADCAALCPMIPEKASVLDVGTGAGWVFTVCGSIFPLTLRVIKSHLSLMALCGKVLSIVMVKRLAAVILVTSLLRLILQKL